MLLRGVSIPAPLLTADEYAYNILSRYRDGFDIFALDPWLQRIDNPLYLALQHRWIQIGGGDGVLVTRIAHLLEWFAAALLLRAAFSRIVATRVATLGMWAMLLLPMSFYTLTVMPETDLVCMAALLGFMIIRHLAQAPLRTAAAAGVICGLGLLIKPHAVAWLPATLVPIFCLAWVRRREPTQARIAAAAIAVFAACWYLAFLFGWKLSTGGWELHPSAALGLKLYGKYVAAADTAKSPLYSLALIGTYVVGHAIAIVLVFGPALAGALTAWWRTSTNHDKRDDALLCASSFALAMLASHVAMAAYFSASVGLQNAGEAARLHGRYLESALIFLPFFYLAFLHDHTRRSLRILSLIAIAGCAAFYFFVYRFFKIFPWDYPELFAFFVSPNHYQWAYNGDTTLGYYAVGACVLGFAAAFVAPRWSRRILLIQLLLLMVLGHYQMQRWLTAHIELNADRIDMASALGKSLLPANPGDGMLVGEDRFGKMSSVLFNLGSAPRVLVRTAGSKLTAADITGAHWVVTTAPYDVEFPHNSLIRFGELSLYPINIQNPTAIAAEKKDWDGETFQLKLGTDGGAALQGFNMPEVWGAWTSQQTAAVELPWLVQGKIRIKLFGWVIPENPAHRVRITLGDGVAELEMTGTGADYQIDLESTHPSDRIKFSIPPIRPDDSARDLGVAIARMEISR